MEQHPNKNDVQQDTSGKRVKKKRRKKKKQKPLKTITKKSEPNLQTPKEPKGIVSIEDQTSIPRKDDSEPDEEVLKETFNIAPSESKNQLIEAPPLYNTRYLSETDETYCLERFQSNTMIIFNHTTFEDYVDRVSGKQDVLNLRKTFKEYDFHSDNIFEYTNYDCKDIKAAIKTFSESDFTHFGCVVVVVITHGAENGYLIASDDKYHESVLINPFLYNGNQTLITKPKIFLIQTCACPGCHGETAGLCSIDSKNCDRDDKTLPNIYNLSKEADILIIYGMDAGIGSSCCEAKGSWHINSLCSALTSYADEEHFEDILIVVKNDVATENPETGNTKLHLVPLSCLTRKLYFKKSQSTLEDQSDDKNS